MTIDAGEVARILDGLDDDDRLLLAEALEPPWRVRQRRLNARDQLIRAELAGAAGASLTVRAATLSRRLSRPAADDATACRVLLLNGGRGIGWQHLLRIARDARTPDPRINDCGDAQPAPTGFGRERP